MAKKLGMSSKKLYHDRESGKVPFSADELAIVAKAFGVPVAELYRNHYFNDEKHNRRKEDNE